ncbi:MFS transporter [Pseudonocardia spirodelae]|uniref:MFS transporter n=1 Tax=Pseudonocardia spirodelae TaxID=3133431 RepID=A0ABU8T6Z6_9PSEU
MTDAARDTDRPPAGPVGEDPLPRRVAVFAVVGLALLMFSLDQTSVATALTTIGGDLGADLAWAGWVVTIAAVGQILALPLGGWLSDRFGGRRMFLAGVAAFTVMSGLSAVSPSIGVLIACRFVQGLAGGVMLPAANGVVAHQFGRDRDRALALFTSVFPIGAILGPLVGGLVLTTWSWHGIFLLNVPLGIVLVVAGLALVDDPPHRRTGRVDGAGIALLVLTLLATMVTVTRLGSPADGPVWTVLAGALALGAGAAFVRHARRRPDAVVPVRLLAGRGLGIMNTTNVVFGAVVIGFSATLPLYAQVRYDLSAFAAGALLTGRAVGTIVTSPVAVALLRRLGFRPLLLGGLVAVVGGLVITAVAPPVAEPTVWLLAGSTLLGLGTGLCGPAANNAGMHLVPDDVAAVSGLRIMFRQMGGIAAVSVLTAAVTAADDPGLAAGVAYGVLAALLAAVGVLAARIPNRRGRW